MRRLRKLRSELSYLRWLWANRAEWRDRWNDENMPALTAAQALALLRVGNQLRTLILAGRKGQGLIK